MGSGSRALDLLMAMVDRAGDIVGKREIVWRGVDVDEAGLEVHVARPRRIPGDGADGSQCGRNGPPGRGYSFVGPIRRHAPDGPLLPAGNEAAAPPSSVFHRPAPS